MSSSLVPSRNYLATNRRSIIGRAIGAAVAGAVPIPILDDWLVSSIRQSMLRRIADAHGIDISDKALQELADGPESAPKWTELVGGGLILRIVSRQWKKLVFAVMAARRAQAAAKNFEIGTLFDHYCARRHQGLGLVEGDGLRIRALIDQARDDTDGGLSRHAFRKALVAAARGSVKAPVEAADFLVGGRIQKLLRGGDEDEVHATTEVDEALEREMRSHSSFLGKAATAVEFELSVDRNDYLEKLIENFDRLCTDEGKGES